MLVPFIALAVVVIGVIIYIITQASRKTRDQGNR